MPSQKILSIVLAITLGFLMQSSFAESYYVTATRLVAERKYNQALTQLVYALRTDPRDISALNLAGNCCVMLGERDTGYMLYWHIVRAFPSSKDAYSLRAYLRQNDPLYATRAANNQFASVLPVAELLATEKKFNPQSANSSSSNSGRTSSASSTVTNISSSSTRSGAQKSEGLSKSQIINLMVKTVRPLKDHPAVSPALVDRTKSVLMRYPAELIALLYDEGYTVCLTPTLIDRDPELANTQPSGYEDGATYKDCPGMFDARSKQLVICEYTIANGFDCNPAPDPTGTLLHEGGHAIDFLLGAQERRYNKSIRHIWYFSETDQFKHAYYLDSGKITDDSVKSKLNYFLQKSNRGPCETFAELMCQKFGGASEKRRVERGQMVTSTFPQALSIINNRLAQLERTGK